MEINIVNSHPGYFRHEISGVVIKLLSTFADIIDGFKYALNIDCLHLELIFNYRLST